MRFIIINLFFINFAGANCTIYFYKNTLYTGTKKSLNKADVIKESNCQKDVSSKFHQIVINSSGTLKSKYLGEIDPNITFYPKHFYLTPLKKILQEKMDLSPGQELNKIRYMNGIRAIHIRNNQIFDLSNKFKTGKLAFTLEIREENGAVQTVWIEAEGTKVLEVYVASFALSPSNDTLNLGLFSKVKRKVTNPNLYFLDDKTLPYYKLNHLLREGEILKKSALIKKNLVTFGNPAKVIYKKGNLVLQGMGIPLGSGRFGDFVKLRNPKNKKEIFGQVNGPNSVLVGL